MKNVVKMQMKYGHDIFFSVRKWENNPPLLGYHAIVGVQDQNKLRWMLSILLKFGVQRSALAVFNKDGQYLLAYYSCFVDSASCQAGYCWGLISAASHYRRRSKKARRKMCLDT